MSVGQAGSWEVRERLRELSARGDPLEELAATVEFELFRAGLAAAGYLPMAGQIVDATPDQPAKARRTVKFSKARPGPASRTSRSTAGTA